MLLIRIRSDLELLARYDPEIRLLFNSELTCPPSCTDLDPQRNRRRPLNIIVIKLKKLILELFTFHTI